MLAILLDIRRFRPDIVARLLRYSVLGSFGFSRGKAVSRLNTGGSSLPLKELIEVFFANSITGRRSIASRPYIKLLYYSLYSTEETLVVLALLILS